MWSLKRNDTNVLTNKTETHRLRKQAYGDQWERDSYGFWDEHVYTTIFKMITIKAILYSTGNSAQCYGAAWMGGEFGGECIHVYVWLNPFIVPLKLSPHC